MKSLVLLSVGLLLALVEAKVSYEGHQVLRVASTDYAKDLIRRHSLSTWADDFGEIDVVVPPGFKELNELKPRMLHADLGRSIAEESQSEVYLAGSANATWFNSYHPYADHVQFVKDLQAAHTVNSALLQIGNSLEGRPVTGIQIWGGAGQGKKPAVLIHGNVHAREWITSMTVEYLAFNLLDKYSSDSTIKALVDKFDIHILPVVNPDGFVYSQTTDRLWRKTRARPTASCPGTDINRNWNNHWSAPGGASTDPCAEDYKGTAAEDQAETKVLSAYARKLGSSAAGFKLFIDFHSYAQVWNWPYNYACDVTAATDADLTKTGVAAANAIKAVYGATFTTGPGCEGLYPTSGESSDYHYDVAKAQYSYTVELRDTGKYGFVLPANQILPSGTETFAGLKATLQTMK